MCHALARERRHGGTGDHRPVIRATALLAPSNPVPTAWIQDRPGHTTGEQTCLLLDPTLGTVMKREIELRRQSMNGLNTKEERDGSRDGLGDGGR